jgi:hypothetical protein
MLAKYDKSEHLPTLCIANFSWGASLYAIHNQIRQFFPDSEDTQAIYDLLFVRLDFYKERFISLPLPHPTSTKRLFAACPKCFRIFSTIASRDLHFETVVENGVEGIRWLSGMTAGLLVGRADLIRHHRHAVLKFSSQYGSGWEAWTHSTDRPDEVILVILLHVHAVATNFSSFTNMKCRYSKKKIEKESL